MILAANLKRCLDAHRIGYRVFPVQHSDNSQSIQAQVFVDSKGLLLVAYQQGTRVDLQALQVSLKRTFTAVPAIQINRLFKDCDPGCWPPVGQAYDLEMVIDNQIKQNELLNFSSGSNTSVIQINTVDFLGINSRAKILACTVSDPKPVSNQGQIDNTIFPQLPSFAQFSQIIMTSTANSDFWTHARYAASYAEKITSLVAVEHKLDPKLSHAAGLLHNIGLLLFSQLFPPEYALLRKWMLLNPRTSIAVLEHRILGMGAAFNIIRQGHAKFGESLLRSWQAPEPICVVAREHHSLMYQGEYAAYVKIMQLTNQLLRTRGIGDGTAGGIYDQLVQGLGLSVQEIENAVQDLEPAGLETSDIYAIIAGCIGL